MDCPDDPKKKEIYVYQFVAAKETVKVFVTVQLILDITWWIPIYPKLSIKVKISIRSIVSVGIFQKKKTNTDAYGKRKYTFNY